MILVISVAAAYGGFVESKTADNIQDLRSDIKFSEQELDTVITEVDQMVAEDIDFQIHALYYLDQAWIESWSYSIMKPSLTPLEQLERVDKIYSNIVLATEWITSTLTFQLYNYFENGGTELTIFSLEGAEIKKSDYDGLINDLVNTTDLVDLLSFRDFAETEDISDYIGPYSLDLPVIDELIKLLAIPVVDISDKIVDLNNELYKEESIQAGLRMAISVITVATVLSAAMASRLRFRKTQVAFSEVRSDIHKDKEYLIGSGDKIAALVLSIGVLIATIGLMLAI